MTRRVRFSFGGALIAWLIVAAIVGYVFLTTLLTKPTTESANAAGAQLDVSAKTAVALKSWQPGQAAGQLPELDKQAKTPTDKLKVAIIAGEISNAEAAHDRLAPLLAAPTTLPAATDKPGLLEAARKGGVPPVAPIDQPLRDAEKQAFKKNAATQAGDLTDEQLAALEASRVAEDAADLLLIYDEDSATNPTPAARQRVVDRYSWYGHGALAFGQTAGNTDRDAFDKTAGRVMVFLFSIIGVVGVAFVVGLVLLILAIVFFCLGKIPSGLDERLAEDAWRGETSAFDSDTRDLRPEASRRFDAPPSRDPNAPRPFPPVPAGPWQTQSQSSYPAPTNYPVPGYAPPRVATAPKTIWGSQRVPNGGVYIETFALYLVLFLGIGAVLSAMGRIKPPLVYGAMLVVICLSALWPLVRGVSVRAWRTAMGVHTGRGVLREIAAGVLGYVTCLPLVAAGLIVTLILVKLSGTNASHPIQDVDISKAGTALMLYFLAAFFAPVTEELMFRGALLGHLRGTFGVILSSLFSGLIFAAIHPQGWALIPGLGTIGVVLALIRHWRGSLIASTVAHALHNGTLITIMVVMQG